MQNKVSKRCEFLDNYGTFKLEQPENISYLYFPVAGEQGMKGAVTPKLGGDLKRNQNEFILQPVSAEDLHNNKSTRNFWCTLEDGTCWSATGASATEEANKFTAKQEKSTLTAGPMWHQMERTSEAYGISSTIISFVPVSDYNVEMMHVSIKNNADTAVSFVPTAAVPVYGRSADNIRDHRHVTSLLHTIETTQKGVLVTPTLSFDERGHQRNFVTYYVCAMDQNGAAPVGFMPIVEDFIGEGGSFERPESLLNGRAFDEAGKQYAGYEAVGAIQFANVTLQPGETVSYTVFIGAENEKADIDKMLAAYSTENAVMDALEQTKQYWRDKINVSYETADKAFDNFMYWVNFQPMLRRIYGCSFLPHHDYGKGGRGWRDLWQDCLALLIMNPDGVRQMLIDNYGGVRMDGSNATIIGTRQGEFIADRNNITRVWMDHGLWPLITTKLYLDQTGDLSVLLKENTYFKDKQEARGTKTDTAWTDTTTPVLKDAQGKEYSGTILEHILVQNLTAFYDVGEHNHMKLRGADWNDALDMASKRGESVAFTAAYAGNLEMLAEIIATLKEELNMTQIEVAEEMAILFTKGQDLYDSIEKKEALLAQYCEACFGSVSGKKTAIDCDEMIDSLTEKAQWLKEHIRATEWMDDENGGWFNSYYDDNGRKVEGQTENGVRMMLTGQVFTIMSGTATEEQIAKMTTAADAYLYEEKVGGYKLNTDFHELKTDLGRMFGFAYGHKENGAVFSHMTTMYANALYKRGFVKEAYKALNTLYRQSADFETSKIYPGIPEYFNDRGRGMYHYLTGAASWMMLTVITEMFGVKGKKGALYLEPQLIKEQFDSEGKAAVTLNFGKRRWHITYVNANGADSGEYQIGSITLNGVKKDVASGEAVVTLEEIKALEENMQHELVVELV
ncbi:MAG: cellobiose phosphorylase [Lachnospiraceae bacterium]|nr:cellobiose phosphorylase [Lachnospiraceae bacterium]